MKTEELINLTKCDIAFASMQIQLALDNEDPAEQCYWQGWAQAKEDSLDTFKLDNLLVRLKIQFVEARCKTDVANLLVDVANAYHWDGYAEAKKQDADRAFRVTK